jgi:hypothetical protein
MNAWIVKFDRGNLCCCVSWIWKKAYDHVNWDLLYLLQRCGFGEKWRASMLRVYTMTKKERSELPNTMPLPRKVLRAAQHG